VDDMNVLIAGAGPTGLTLGGTLARRGHRVLAVDRDPGPQPDGSWRRRGVMQFEHPHGFRPQVRDLLVAEWPEVWQRWVALGAEPVELSFPGSAPKVGILSRRLIYERALREEAANVRGLTVMAGHVDGIVERGGRVVGAVVDGATVSADLVVDAGGRISALAPPADLGGDTGMSYVTRTYRRSHNAGPGPTASPVAWSAMLRGYDVYVFFHERRHISAVIIRPNADGALSVLRHVDAFDAACRAIPGLAEWTDPRVAAPTSGVMVGGRLLNLYRRQLHRPGLVAVGDAVATTAPTAGRGVAMASMQITALLALFDGGADPVTVADPFGAWCDASILPWVEDHLVMDAESVSRWQGHDIDLTQPLTSAAIVAATQADARIGPHIGGFLNMESPPASLAPAEPLARAVYEAGWRPSLADGPTQDELVAVVEGARAPTTRHAARRRARQSYRTTR
jgi:2-polyprenyl-6-methoxyphenol hydroxylase-like FAD-dependent oxidoreductase